MKSDNSNLNISIFNCPVCQSPLKTANGVPICQACDRTFKTPYGLLDFSHDAEFYWGELEREAMQRLLAVEESVEDALLTMLNEEQPELREYLSHYALDRFRAGWKYLCKLPEDGRVLDFGCGWGALALSLAEHVRETWVCDVVPERVEMVRRRAQSRGLDNFHGCISSGWPNLPFLDHFFDFVVLNGVLEWIPSSIQGKPEKIQQHFLTEVVRVLKPGGQLYIGIENRFGFSYFRGKPEEHTKLKFISLFPRFLGRLYHRIANKAPYKEYTYGRHGLKKLLRRAGFKSTTFFYPYPDYREFNCIVDLDSMEQLDASFVPQSRRGKSGYWIAKKTGLLRLFANSFGVLASKQENGSSSLLKDLVEQIRTDNLSAQFKHYKITGAGNILIRLKGQNENDFLLTLPIDEVANQRLANEVNIRNKIFANSTISHNNLITSGEYRGINYKLEEYLCAQDATSVPEDEIRPKVINTLIEIHKPELKHGTFCCRDFFENEWVDSFMAELDAPDTVFPVSVWQQTISTQLSCYHGDFHLGNILINENHDISAVIDWDLAGLEGLPTWDLLNSICHARFEESNDWTDAYVQTCKIVLDNKNEHISHYVKNLNLSPVDLHLAMLTYPLLQWKNKMLYGDKKGRVITKGITEEWKKHADFISVNS